MRLILDNCSEWVCKWVGEQLNCNFGPAYGLAIVHRDETVAGVVYHDLRTDPMGQNLTVVMSLASVSPHWCSKLVLKAIFGYPFNQLGVARVSVIIRAPDESATRQENIRRKWWNKRLIHGFGFVFETKLENWFGEGKDAYLLRMKRAECRWIDGLRQGIERKQLSAV